ncbi:MAG TPA: hypothetical protein VGQ79_02270 [Nitrospiraceae bacterium]|nr:hypothetical protein [Nitrospiraceae bacterium]
MRFLLFVVGSLLLLGLGRPASAATLASEPVLTWNFDGDSRDQLPPKFIMGTFFDGRPAGDWKVMESPKAISPPNVLAQLRNKGGEHNYNLVLVDDTNSSDLDLSVSFLPISGKADMGGGLVWRAQNDRNYYLTRANPLEQNIRVYHVVNGIRKMLKNFDQIIDVRKWHSLRVINRGCQIQVFYDDRKIFDLCDETFREGRIGLWTKSDAVTYFDDLRLTILR